MSKPQVRLDPDVAEVLQRDADRKGHSLNVAANAWLRRGLGLPGAGRDTGKVATAPAPARITPAQAVSPTDCPHPVGRRLGPHCGQCGATLKVRPAQPIRP